jgi:hypothetical protein
MEMRLCALLAAKARCPVPNIWEGHMINPTIQCSDSVSNQQGPDRPQCSAIDALRFEMQIVTHRQRLANHPE